MTNIKRSPEFIKMKHSINSCTDYIQLEGMSRVLNNIPDNNEFLVLMDYYRAKQHELSLDTLILKPIL